MLIIYETVGSHHLTFSGNSWITSLSLCMLIYTVTGTHLIFQASEDHSEEMQNASDALEFQQTEIMRAKDALRSIRAKLAVLEGRMTMAVMYSWLLIS